MDSILGRVIGIAITLILVVGVVIASSSLFADSKASNAENDLTTLITNIQAAYATQPNFNGLTEQISNNAKWTPSDMLNGATIVNQWGGTVTLGVVANSQFTVTEPNVPRDGCIKLISSLPTAQSIAVNGAAALTALDPASLVTACSSPTSNSIVFTMGH
jgi:type II secretory pathway pseudopilin PulG